MMSAGGGICEVTCEVRSRNDGERSTAVVGPGRRVAVHGDWTVAECTESRP